MKKKRADDLLIDHGLVADREEAARVILARQIFLPDRPLSSPAELLPADTRFHVKPRASAPYVSRGGLKLAAALKAFSVNVTERVCLDIGISTGGFADCLLQHGARQVIGIDVGYGQLAHRLRQDKRVTIFEKTNIMTFDLSRIKDPISLVVMDLSFISAQKVMTKISSHIGNKNPHFYKTCFSEVICLLKPQFELARRHVPAGGIVRNETTRLQSLSAILAHAALLGWGEGAWIPSPILGRKGNQEYLVYWKF